MTLSEHGPEPRAETAAAMEILKERSPFASSLDNAKQLCIE
jgi:hypothetical protein